MSLMTAARLERRRDDILDAAERVFAEKGYHEAGIADIAEVLGIGHGTFYRYFKNKQDIAANVLERVVDRIGQAALVEDPEASRTVEEYRAQVVRILERMFNLLDDHPHLMRFFHQQSVVVDSKKLFEALDRYAEFTEGFLRNGIERGFLRADLEVEITAQAMVGLVFEGTRRALHAPTAPDIRRRWIDAGVALVFEGIAGR